MTQVQLRRLCRIVNGGTPSSDEDNWNGEFAWATPVDLGAHDGQPIATTQRTLTYDGLNAGSAMVPAGSVILSTRAPIGYVSIAKTNMAFNQGCRGLVLNDKVHVRYFMYALLHLRPWLKAAGTGSTFMELSSATLAEQRIPLVGDVVAQMSLADFLDRETAKIDVLIAKQQRLVSALSERHAALLLRATMEPENDWVQVRIGQVLRKLERHPNDLAVVITAYRDGQVTSRENRREDGYTLSFTEKDYQGVHAGDLVFHALDGFAGAVGVSDSDGKCTPVYHVCEPLVGNNTNYLALHLRALGQAGFLTAFAWSVRQRSVDYRNWTLFASLPICVPRPYRQSEIAMKLARETAKIDRLAVKARELIAVMKERRAALISATVTGQIDVTTYGNED